MEYKVSAGEGNKIEIEITPGACDAGHALLEAGCAYCRIVLLDCLVLVLRERRDAVLASTSEQWIHDILDPEGGE